MISQLVRVWIRGVQTQSSKLQLQPGFVSYQTEEVVGRKTRLDYSPGGLGPDTLHSRVFSCGPL